MNPLSLSSFANMFSHSLGCLFVLFRVSFAVQKLLNLIKSHWFFCSYCYYSRIMRRYCFGLYQRVFGLCFPSRVLCYLVFYLGLSSILHLLLCVVLGSVLFSFFSLWLSWFHGIIYWRYSLFSIVCSRFYCHRLVDCRRVGLILGFLSCSTDVHFCLCASTIWFWCLVE